MSEYDVYLLVGAVLIVLGIVSTFTAMVDGRFPGLGLTMVVLATGSLYMASTLATDGMSVADIPAAVVKLVAVVFN